MIYFDNAATTRALPAVAEKMSTMLCEQYGNPASVSAMGLAAEKEIRNAAEIIARGIHCNMMRFSLLAAAQRATTGRFTARQRATKDRERTLLQRKLNTLR